MSGVQRAGGVSGAGFSAPVSTKRNVFGAARYVPGLQRVHLFDTKAQTLAPNTSFDIPLNVAVATGEPVVVVVLRAASTTKSTSDGTIAVSTVHANATTTALTKQAGVGGSSVNNFHGDFYSGVMQGGDTAIRITSATADASTVIAYRACIWSKIVGAAAFSNLSTSGAHPPITKGPIAAAASGGAAFLISDSWSGSSAAKSVTWNQPNALPTLPGQAWLSQVFTIAGSQYPIVVNLARAAPAATFQYIGSGTDWLDAVVYEATSNWGE